MQGSNPTSSLKTSHISYWHNLRSHKKWERFTRADLVGRFSAEAGLELRPEDGLSDFRKPLGVGDQVPENAAGKNDRFRIRWHFWAGGGKKVVFEGKHFCWSEKPETGFFFFFSRLTSNVQPDLSDLVFFDRSPKTNLFRIRCFDSIFWHLCDDFFGGAIWRWRKTFFCLA